MSRTNSDPDPDLDSDMDIFTSSSSQVRRQFDEEGGKRARVENRFDLHRHTLICPKCTACNKSWDVTSFGSEILDLSHNPLMIPLLPRSSFLLWRQGRTCGLKEQELEYSARAREKHSIELASNGCKTWFWLFDRDFVEISRGFERFREISRGFERFREIAFMSRPKDACQ